jgi:hypothetical protein
MIRHPHRFAVLVFTSVLAVWLVAMFGVMRAAVLHPSANGIMMVVFDPGIDDDNAFAAITRAGAQPIRKTAFGFIWVVDGNAGKLLAEGALGSYRQLPISPEIAGCVAVVDAKVAAAFGI